MVTTFRETSIPPQPAALTRCRVSGSTAFSGRTFPPRRGLSFISGRCSVAVRMIPPVQVSPLIKFTRYSALLVGMIYGKKRYDYLKPVAAEERRIEAEEKKKREELERIAKELAEASEESILK
ncbi:ATP synthase subunit e, mitochondrial [Patagioenas fasciata]